MKVFSHCNNSIMRTKNKGFVLLEVFAALFAGVILALVIAAALSYAAMYHAEARMLRGALLYAAQTIDKALSIGLPAGSYFQGQYRVEVLWVSEKHKKCRVTCFYTVGKKQKTIILANACMEPS